MNQCMGCQAGWPLMLMHGGWYAHRTKYPSGALELVGCTRDRYVAPADYPEPRIARGEQ